MKRFAQFNEGTFDNDWDFDKISSTQIVEIFENKIKT